jgi:hypothetical protein
VEHAAILTTKHFRITTITTNGRETKTQTVVDLTVQSQFEGSKGFEYSLQS